MDKLRNVLEAILFVSGDPIAPEPIAESLGITALEVGSALEALRVEYEENQRGIQLRYVDGKAQLCSNRAYAPQIEALLQPEQTRSFSQSVIETLAIIAYKQPVTRADIEAIRGVRCEYSVTQLLALGLIEEAGRKPCVGRPALFATTEKFLTTFGLSSLERLPQRETFLHSAEESLETMEV